MSRSFGHLFMLIAIVFGLACTKPISGKQTFEELDQSCFYVARNFDRESANQIIKKQNALTYNKNKQQFAGLSGRYGIEDIVQLRRNSKLIPVDSSVSLSSKQISALAPYTPSVDQNSCQYEESAAWYDSESVLIQRLSKYGKQFATLMHNEGSDIVADIAHLNPASALFASRNSGRSQRSVVKKQIANDEFASSSPSLLWWDTHALQQAWLGPQEPDSYANQCMDQIQSCFGCQLEYNIEFAKRLAENIAIENPAVDPGTRDYWEYYAKIDAFDLDLETQAIVEKLISEWRLGRWLLDRIALVNEPVIEWSHAIFVEQGTKLVSQLNRLHHGYASVPVPDRQPEYWGLNEYRDLAFGYLYIGRSIAESDLFSNPKLFAANLRIELDIQCCGSPWMPLWYDAVDAISQQVKLQREFEHAQVVKVKAIAALMNWAGNSLNGAARYLTTVANAGEPELASTPDRAHLK